MVLPFCGCQSPLRALYSILYRFESRSVLLFEQHLPILFALKLKLSISDSFVQIVRSDYGVRNGKHFPDRLIFAVYFDLEL